MRKMDKKDYEQENNNELEEILNKRTMNYEDSIKSLNRIEYKDIIDMRKTWNCFIKFFVALLISTQIVIIFLIGFHKLNYDSNTVISIFFSETFLQIVGLAIIVVKYLFPQIYQTK